MDDDRKLEALHARVAELEAQNHELRAASPSAPGAAHDRTTAGRWRAVVAAVLITVAVVLAPVATLGTWARTQLVDTERFVQTFAPLAHEPAVQSFVSDQVMDAIDENLDIDGLVGDLFAGIDGLGLPPRAAAALALLEAPAADGVRSLIADGVDRVVESPQFANLWEGALRETHRRAIAVIQGDPNAVLRLSEDGTLSLELSVVIEQVKEALVARGLGFAERIPAIDRSIPIVTADALVLVRTIYQVAVAAGYWLPWAVLGLLGVGIAVARRRARALAWAGFGLAASFLLLAAGMGIGEQFFIGTVSPSVMPAATAQTLFDQLTALISSTILALVVLGVFVGIGGWLAGGSAPARAVRGIAGPGFAAVRSAADRHGLDPRGFGALVERWRSAIVAVTAGIGVLVLFLNRPATVGSVLSTLVVVLAVLVVVELVRRPAIGMHRGEVEETRNGDGEPGGTDVEPAAEATAGSAVGAGADTGPAAQAGSTTPV